MEAIDVKPPTFVSENLAKALAHPLRIKIVDELNERPMSVSEFVKAFPQYTHSQVYKHFRKLEELKCLEVVETKTGGSRRGAVEHFYRATVRSLFDESSWANLPDSLKNKITAGVFSTYMERVAEAITKGTIDSRPDRHFTWSEAFFDQQAWDETIEEIEDLFQRIPIRNAEASARLAKTDAKPVPVTIALACFESPDA